MGVVHGVSCFWAFPVIRASKLNKRGHSGDLWESETHMLDLDFSFMGNFATYSMGRTCDVAQLVGVIGAAMSLLAYAYGAGLSGLGAFGVCVVVFAAASVSEARTILPSVTRTCLGGVSLLHQTYAKIARNLYLPSLLSRQSRGRTPTVRVKRPRAKSRTVAMMGPHVRRTLDSVVGASALRRVYSELNPNMLKSVTLSGVATDLAVLRREAGAALIVSGLVAVALIALLVTMPELAGLIVLAFALPITMLFYPRAKLRLAASERKRALADEMAFFAAYCLLLAEVGKTVVYGLASISGRGIFPALEREARVMERGRGLGMGKMVALGDLARNHPNRSFGDLIGGYVAAFNAGEPKAHLKSQTDELLRKMHKRLEAYKEHSSSLCVMVTFMMVFLPVMITPIAMIAGPGSALFLTQISLLAMPVMAAMVCVAAHAVQPKFGDTIRCDWRIPACLAVGTAAIAWVLEPGRIWPSMVGAAIVFAACATVMTHKQRRITSAIERNQGPFFRNITSYINAGDSSISRAMGRVTSQGRGQYDDIFVSIISRANFRIRHAGELIQDVLADTARESWLGRFSFFLLSRIADTGSVDAWVLTLTTEFVERFVSLKRDIISAIKPYMVIAVVSPAGVIAMTWFLKSILAGFPTSLGDVQAFDAGVGIARISITSEFDEAINVLTVVSAICANVTVAKIASMSITDMRPLLAGAIVALLCILAVSYLPVPS